MGIVLLNPHFYLVRQDNSNLCFIGEETKALKGEGTCLQTNSCYTVQTGCSPRRHLHWSPEDKCSHTTLPLYDMGNPLLIENINTACTFQMEAIWRATGAVSSSDTGEPILYGQPVTCLANCRPTWLKASHWVSIKSTESERKELLEMFCIP